MLIHVITLLMHLQISHDSVLEKLLKLSLCGDCFKTIYKCLFSVS